jgi:hypothetical protein
MGRVFSFEQVKGGEVPERSDFKQSLDRFRIATGDEIEKGTISGAVVFGSVALGSYSIRSDFDCMIVPYDHSRSSIEAIRRISHNTNPTGRIEFNPIIHSQARLELGNHEIDSFFGEHLTGEGRIVVGRDPSEYLHFADRDAAEVLHNYIRHKKRSVARAFSINESERYKGLQRVLELPLAIGRKAIRAIVSTQGEDVLRFNTAEKAKVLDKALLLFQSIRLDETPRRIFALDKAYSQVLAEAVRSKVSVAQYQDIIGLVEDMAIDASNWLDDIEVGLAPLLDDGQS